MLAQQWVDNQQILLLLDGLDEMEEIARPACIAAINLYHRERIAPLVVCSRSQEYQTASAHERLHLHSAVEVQPLTAIQMEEALQQIGNAKEGLLAELMTNKELRELVRAPLWLNVILVTTREAPLPSLPQERDKLQQEVLRHYVERMYERKGKRKGGAMSSADPPRYSFQQTRHWLGFLSNQMRQHGQELFAIEDLQPDWLIGRFRRAYRWSVGPFFGLAVGLVGALLFGLVGALLNSGFFGRAWVRWTSRCSSGWSVHRSAL